MAQVVECVPNISEGGDRGIIDACANAAAQVEGCKLLDVDPGADTNRTVITLAGEPEAVLEGAFQLIAASHRLIDMAKHSGAHPRAGATDVCPFVPVSEISMDECVELANRLGKRVGDELDVPVYLYEYAATREERRNLAVVRRGEYEALPRKMEEPEWKPDYGPHEFRPKFGAVHISARKFLIAYNINLNTTNARVAKDIALKIRESGHLLRNRKREIVRNHKGKGKKVPGLFENCKAAGWYLPDYKTAQVTMNLTDPDVTLPHQVFETVRELAREMGARVTGSEIVGLVPLKAMTDAGKYYLRAQGRSTAVHERELVRFAVQSMSLDEISEFEIDRKVVEYAIRDTDRERLAGMTLVEFNDELASDSPAPGGGSVAALAGALAAALAAMVANLTHGKFEYEHAWDEVEAAGVRAQQLKAKMLHAIDADTDAFNAVIAAMRLPKKTDEQKAARAKAIDEANKNATLIPFGVCAIALESFDAIDVVAEKGNPNSVSDAGVAAFCANTAAHAAALNVRINLPGIEDRKWCEEKRKQVAELTAEADRRLKAVRERVETVLAEQREN
ncbi:MAG: Glutamate formimidoyltransferase [Calditrichaeota bacterium]|nr:Glutamate formimidoyltransferase [Calditrichota bacterium]